MPILFVPKELRDHRQQALWGLQDWVHDEATILVHVHYDDRCGANYKQGMRLPPHWFNNN